jgi:hypothetical protein
MKRFLFLPHPWEVKQRWLRRVLIRVTFPYAISLAIVGVFAGAAQLWKQ